MAMSFLWTFVTVIVSVQNRLILSMSERRSPFPEAQSKPAIGGGITIMIGRGVLGLLLINPEWNPA